MIKTISIPDLYKHSCYCNKPKVYLRALRIYGKNQQLKANTLFIENNTLLSNMCRECEKMIQIEDFDYYAGYWIPNLWFPVHKSCKSIAKEQETIACQTIDANCNDCKYFKRGNNKSILTNNQEFLGVDFMITWEESRELEKKGEKVIEQLQLARLARINDEVVFNGFCEDKKISVQAIPNFSTGYSCFKHRKK